MAGARGGDYAWIEALAMSKAAPVLSLVRAVVTAPVRKLAPNGVREAALLAAAKVLGFSHRTNPSGNNMSQR